jgi:hypothetical protein
MWLSSLSPVGPYDARLIYHITGYLLGQLAKATKLTDRLYVVILCFWLVTLGIKLKEMTTLEDKLPQWNACTLSRQVVLACAKTRRMLVAFFPEILLSLHHFASSIYSARAF